MARTITIALGGNLSSPAGFACLTLRAAENAITRAGAVVQARSSLYRTQPMGDKVSGVFINAVLRVRIFSSPAHFFAQLERVEQGFGKSAGGGNRSLDIDLLTSPLYQKEACDLILPHPRMGRRRFVLVPLNELGGGHLPPLTLSEGGACFLLRATKKPARKGYGTRYRRRLY